MKKIVPLIIVSLFACAKKVEYDRQKVAVALVNHSYYKIDSVQAEVLSSDLASLKKIDANADIVSYKSKFVKKEQKPSPLYYPVVFSVDGGILKAAKVFDLSMAYEAGLKSGCEILSVDSRKGSDIASNPAFLSGLMKEGVSFNVEYSCQKSSGKVEIKRELAYFPFVWNMSLSDDSAYVRIMTFSPGISGFVKNNLTNLRASGKKFLVVDLRGVSGGSYEEAASLLNLFIEKGRPLFETRSDKEGYVRKFEARNERSFGDFSLVLLVNSSTASLGEIVAQSLRKNLGARIVGEKTAGKFFITKIFKVGKGEGLRLTVARLTPGDFEMSEPLKPDYEVKDVLGENRDFVKVPFLTSEDPLIKKASEVLHLNL
ncbi:MAG: hypothetical protein Fur0012_13570 [Elusimicrobiota bacterium]